jgi:hypothetical protein
MRSNNIDQTTCSADLAEILLVAVGAVAIFQPPLGIILPRVR